MDVTALFRHIESSEFASQTLVANDADMFGEIAAGDRSVQYLIAASRDSAATARKILSRVEELRALEDDFRYRNARDAAIATYLFVLMQYNRPLAILGAESVVRACNVWWAKRIAVAILSGKSTTPLVGDATKPSPGLHRTAEPHRTGEILLAARSDSRLIREGRVANQVGFQKVTSNTGFSYSSSATTAAKSTTLVVNNNHG